MATLTCPACTAEVQPDDLICFTCGANLPRSRSADEPASPTVMQEYPKREGAAAPPAGFGEDVQIQRPGSGSFTTFKTGATTTSATFTPDAGAGMYLFQARLLCGLWIGYISA